MSNLLRQIRNLIVGISLAGASMAEAVQFMEYGTYISIMVLLVSIVGLIGYRREDYILSNSAGIASIFVIMPAWFIVGVFGPVIYLAILGIVFFVANKRRPGQRNQNLAFASLSASVPVCLISIFIAISTFAKTSYFQYISPTQNGVYGLAPLFVFLMIFLLSNRKDRSSEKRNFRSDYDEDYEDVSPRRIENNDFGKKSRHPALSNNSVFVGNDMQDGVFDTMSNETVERRGEYEEEIQSRPIADSKGNKGSKRRNEKKKSASVGKTQNSERKSNPNKKSVAEKTDTFVSISEPIDAVSDVEISEYATLEELFNSGADEDLKSVLFGKSKKDKKSKKGESTKSERMPRAIMNDDLSFDSFDDNTASIVSEEKESVEENPRKPEYGPIFNENPIEQVIETEEGEPESIKKAEDGGSEPEKVEPIKVKLSFGDEVETVVSDDTIAFETGQVKEKLVKEEPLVLSVSGDKELEETENVSAEEENLENTADELQEVIAESDDEVEEVSVDYSDVSGSIKTAIVFEDEVSSETKEIVSEFVEIADLEVKDADDEDEVEEIIVDYSDVLAKEKPIIRLNSETESYEDEVEEIIVDYSDVLVKKKPIIRLNHETETEKPKEVSAEETLETAVASEVETTEEVMAKAEEVVETEETVSEETVEVVAEDIDEEEVEKTVTSSSEISDVEIEETTDVVAKDTDEDVSAEESVSKEDTIDVSEEIAIADESVTAEAKDMADDESEEVVPDFSNISASRKPVISFDDEESVVGEIEFEGISSESIVEIGETAASSSEISDVEIEETEVEAEESVSESEATQLDDEMTDIVMAEDTDDAEEVSDFGNASVSEMPVLIFDDEVSAETEEVSSEIVVEDMKEIEEIIAEAEERLSAGKTTDVISTYTDDEGDEVEEVIVDYSDVLVKKKPIIRLNHETESEKSEETSARKEEPSKTTVASEVEVKEEITESALDISDEESVFKFEDELEETVAETEEMLQTGETNDFVATYTADDDDEVEEIIVDYSDVLVKKKPIIRLNPEKETEKPEEVSAEKTEEETLETAVASEVEITEEVVAKAEEVVETEETVSEETVEVVAEDIDEEEVEEPASDFSNVSATRRPIIEFEGEAPVETDDILSENVAKDIEESGTEIEQNVAKETTDFVATYTDEDDEVEEIIVDYSDVLVEKKPIIRLNPEKETEKPEEVSAEKTEEETLETAVASEVEITEEVVAEAEEVVETEETASEETVEVVAEDIDEEEVEEPASDFSNVSATRRPVLVFDDEVPSEKEAVAEDNSEEIVAKATDEEEILYDSSESSPKRFVLVFEDEEPSEKETVAEDNSEEIVAKAKDEEEPAQDEDRTYVDGKAFTEIDIFASEVYGEDLGEISKELEDNLVAKMDEVVEDSVNEEVSSSEDSTLEVQGTEVTEGTLTENQIFTRGLRVVGAMEERSVTTKTLSSANFAQTIDTESNIRDFRTYFERNAKYDRYVEPVLEVSKEKEEYRKIEMSEDKGEFKEDVSMMDKFEIPKDEVEKIVNNTELNAEKEDIDGILDSLRKSDKPVFEANSVYSIEEESVSESLDDMVDFIEKEGKESLDLVYKSGEPEQSSDFEFDITEIPESVLSDMEQECLNLHHSISSSDEIDEKLESDIEEILETESLKNIADSVEEPSLEKLSGEIAKNVLKGGNLGIIGLSEESLKLAIMGALSSKDEEKILEDNHADTVLTSVENDSEETESSIGQDEIESIENVDEDLDAKTEKVTDEIYENSLDELEGMEDMENVILMKDKLPVDKPKLVPIQIHIDGIGDTTVEVPEGDTENLVLNIKLSKDKTKVIVGEVKPEKTEEQEIVQKSEEDEALELLKWAYGLDEEETESKAVSKAAITPLPVQNSYKVEQVEEILPVESGIEIVEAVAEEIAELQPNSIIEESVIEELSAEDSSSELEPEGTEDLVEETSDIAELETEVGDDIQEISDVTEVQGDTIKIANIEVEELSDVLEVEDEISEENESVEEPQDIQMVSIEPSVFEELENQISIENYITERIEILEQQKQKEEMQMVAQMGMEDFEEKVPENAESREMGIFCNQQEEYHRSHHFFLKTQIDFYKKQMAYYQKQMSVSQGQLEFYAQQADTYLKQAEFYKEQREDNKDTDKKSE